MITAFPTQPGKILGGVQAVATALSAGLVESDQIDSLYVLNFYVGSPPLKHISHTGKFNIIFVKAPNFLEAPTFFLVDWLRASIIANRIHPDVVHGQGIGKDGFIASHLSYPSLTTVHGVSSVEARLTPRTPRNKLLTRLIDRRIGSVLRKTQVVISTTKYDANIIRSQVTGRHLIIPNPVALEYFSDWEENDASRFIDHREILFAGTIIPRKNVIGILKAFKQVLKTIPDARLTLIGPHTDQVYAQKCINIANHLEINNNIKFLGHVEQSVLNERLKACACLVMFSDEETSPTILMQAMALGKPVVASSVGGIPEFVLHEQTGYLVNKQNESDLSEKLISILKNKEKQFQMGNYAHEFAEENFSPAKIVTSTVEAYGMALESKSRIRE